MKPAVFRALQFRAPRGEQLFLLIKHEFLEVSGRRSKFGWSRNVASAIFSRSAGRSFLALSLHVLEAPQNLVLIALWLTDSLTAADFKTNCGGLEAPDESGPFLVGNRSAP